MTQYKRITGKVFGGNATATGNDPQIAQFGSALAGTFIGTTDPQTIQQLPAWGEGWSGAVTPETQFPPMPEMTGAMKVLSHQICGILQQGVSTWDSGTIYYTGNFCSKNGAVYVSLTDENQGNDPVSDTANWRSYGGANLDLSNLSAVGEKHFLNKTQITNCLLELPQTINLEIVDGELVLKKGSTFILPNGVGNFERITTTADVKRATFSIGSYDEMYIQMHIPNSTGKAGLSFVLQNNVTVGTEQPTSGMWYNTNENKIVNYTSSGAENALRSFPIAVVKLESGVVTEIKQVFNGLGHFGIARFVDANVKMLIPNGRNSDGTLKNIEYTTTKVAVTTDSKERTNEDLVIASNGSIGVRSKLEYDKQANKNYNHVTGNYEYNCVVAKFSTTTTQTTMFEPKQTFRAVDWFDFNNVQGQLDTLNQNALVDSDKANIVNWLTPDYTAIIANVGGNLGSAYTAPCAGYYIATIGKNDSSAYLKINGAQAYYYTDGGGVSGKVISPFVALVGKGDVCEWSASVDISYTSFVPLKGAN